VAEQSRAYPHLDNAWKSACKILFGRDIGSLSGYREWLLEFVTAPRQEKSAISGRQVSLSYGDYSRNARFAGFDELDFSKKFQPLSINEVKDIDSIVEAVAERMHYAGNIVLGNSKFVESSASVADSHFVIGSSTVSDSKYVAYSHMLRKCSYIFGVEGDADSDFIIRCSDNHNAKRCFECYTAIASSDCYYCMHPQDCRELFFCFGMRSKEYCVGNLALPRDKYLTLKSKLLGELADTLQRDKKVFSLLRVVSEARKHPVEISVPATGVEEKTDIAPMEKAFSHTSSLLLGRELGGMDSYESFLTRHVRPRLVFKSPLSGKKAYLSSYMAKLAQANPIGSSFVTEDELVEVGKISIPKGAVEKIRLDAHALSQILHPIAFCAMCDVIGNTRNLIDCALIGHASDCYRTDAAVYAKKCGYSFWPRESEHIFGSWTVWESSFCMRSYLSKKLTRCFEADTCESCSDLYYSHNCENVNDSMFCFNTKNKRFAIGNAEMPRQQYMIIKQSIISQVAGELESKHDVKWDIFRLAGRK